MCCTNQSTHERNKFMFIYACARSFIFLKKQVFVKSNIIFSIMKCKLIQTKIIQFSECTSKTIIMLPKTLF